MYTHGTDTGTHCLELIISMINSDQGSEQDGWLYVTFSLILFLQYGHFFRCLIMGSMWEKHVSGDQTLLTTLCRD